MTSKERSRPRPRFVPIPIETTFERYRTTIPHGEPTPSPSPKSPSSPFFAPPAPRQKRRFAPQLVEASVRRSRRAGDEGPATKPTDKTDITPYTNHIYAPKPRKRLGHAGASSQERPKGHARRESCDDELAGGFFNMAARDAQKKLQEVAMTAFPNSGQRIGGAEHFYVREGSEDDSPRGRPLTRGPWNPLSRRNSSEEDISWAFKEMQEHALRLERARSRSRIDSIDLDNMSMDGPPSDAMGLTSAPRRSIVDSPLWTARRASSPSPSRIGDSPVPILRSDSAIHPIGESHMPYVPPESPPIRPIGESLMPYIPSAPVGQAAHMPYAPSSRIPPDTAFGSRQHIAFAPPPPERDMSLERARQEHRRRLRKSPPLLGEDLTFRRCPSPKQTKLEPTHLWDVASGRTLEDQNRDPTEQHGLWRGYCYTADKNEMLAPAERPAMIVTPHPDNAPTTDPFAEAFAKLNTAPAAPSEDGSAPPSPSSRDSTHSVPLPGHHSARHALPEHRTRNHEPKGIHMLQHSLASLEDQLRREKEAAELEEKIAAEFDDHFVTQVYNYLSLGYPATARQYDEELSKISHIGVAELEKDDEAIMRALWGEREGDGANGDDGHGKKPKARGHILLDREAKDGVREEDRCSRWKALKKYIHEWARQHPDLNAISPLAWGMQDRRGSWGV
ncbi:hypothetical protein VTJ83DRAFT_6940 [Remersonia thermophila]|uniref:Uncharacterized protein n=1 Tax=Remersonia thermophila TaxID=72144 RepID=A0ABR4D652_9PEZI